jgi:hypothetical protein
MLTPAKSLHDFRFCTLGGVEDVRLEGPEVIGRFKDELVEFKGLPKRRLIEDFLNWPSDSESILRFTRRYGPLQQEPVRGAAFRFPPISWEVDQRFFRKHWRSAAKYPDWQPDGGTLAFRNGRLTYTAKNLYMYLYMDLFTSEAKRLRLCRRPDCPHPYFIAGHLKQRFCSDQCAEWGQREWKKQWWKEHGETWRAKRKIEQEEVKHGTKKAR